ncbi:FadR/GntR family transcriptional regulator [Pseudacidovorax sp. NFM-22]|uniref:FadR/GntR family transcriptional regulator n=1 Tax=Pseudacidovorax sp. NFM-22 TaxID=2744469 RepID=UPI001F2347EF|nr:FadR/GntR family transcriptional regulator [Pseudacidovorax sp. NFM-22]
MPDPRTAIEPMHARGAQAPARPRDGGGQIGTVISGVLAYLRERRLQPGDRLPSERDLAESLAVGRNAVREALAILGTLRVVDCRPNSGVYLRHMGRDSSFEALVMLADMGATPTPTEVAETMEVRAHLELLAAGLACKRRTEDDLQRMEGILARTRAILAGGGNIAEADSEFHLALVEATHNSVLVRVLNAFYRFTALRREALFHNLAQGQASEQDHRQMLTHLRARSAPEAQALILRHMQRARRYWTDRLADAAPAPSSQEHSGDAP